MPIDARSGNSLTDATAAYLYFTISLITDLMVQ